MPSGGESETSLSATAGRGKNDKEVATGDCQIAAGARLDLIDDAVAHQVDGGGNKKECDGRRDRGKPNARAP